jgi:glutamate-1-semialdehyde 2,1-aminomutase
MQTCFIGAAGVRDYADAKCCNPSAFGRWHGAMLSRGVYLAPSQFEATFTSTAHTQADIEQAVAAAAEAFAEIVREP